jgi:hypothetical protein
MARQTCPPGSGPHVSHAVQPGQNTKEGPYKLFEAVRGMDDRWRCIVGICPAHSGVELVGMGLLHVLDYEARVAQAACDMPLYDRPGSPGSQCRQWPGTVCRSCHPRWAYSPAHRLQSGVGSAPRLVISARHVAYLGVVSVASAVAIDRRGVYGCRVWAGWRLEMFGGMS